MKQPGRLFEEPWPEIETRLIIDAIRSAVSGPRPLPSGEVRNRTNGLTAALAVDGGAEANSLTEAGRRWARAHQSALLMRARLNALEASMDTEVGTASEADRAAYSRAWRTVTDAATWTSLTQLEEAALVDPLTGVGNRRALDLMLTRAVSGARRTGTELIVVAVDLDGLKRINDSKGHAAGDRTLTSLVGAFGEGLRASDTVFRTGGDEFAIVLPGMGRGDVGLLMHRISEGGTPAFTWGAAALADEHQRPADLLDAADTDLYLRRGLEREPLGAGAGAGAAAGGGATVVALRPLNGSLRTRASRRTRVTVAAGLVAIAGTLGAVTSFSPANHAALPPKHPSGPTARSGGQIVTPPAATPGPTTPPSTTPPATTPTPAPSAASTPNMQLASVTSPNPGAGSAGAATTGPPSAVTVSTATPPTPVPASPAPVPTAPVATASSSHKPLPAKSAAAAAAAHAKQ